MKRRMDRSPRSKLFLTLAALAVIAKIISDQNVFLILFLLVSCYGMYKEKIEGKIVYLLFFSSWIYVLKLDATSVSFFHLLQLFYLLSCGLSLLKNKNKINLKIILGFLVFVLYIMLNSGFNPNSNPVTVFGFLLNFLTVALTLAALNCHFSYERYVLTYASGLLFSGFVALFGNWVLQIRIFIERMGETYTVYNNHHVYTRFSGLDLDPNYFSLQLLVGVSLLLVVTGYKRRNGIEIAFILLMVVMGFLTLSKMFLIMLIGIALYIGCLYARSKLNKVIKYIFVFMSLLLTILPLGLTDFISLTISRFAEQGGTVTSVTTGRSSLWYAYLQEITGNPRVFLIGNGMGTDYLNGFAAHNMYLSYWYFTGIFGLVALLIFVFYSYNRVQEIYGRHNRMIKRGLNHLPLVVVLMANLSLDSIMMDFFPIHLYLTLLSLGRTIK